MAGMSENEQKQQLSVAYVHAVAARAGYSCQVTPIDDDSIDVQIACRGWVNQQSVSRSPKIEVQLKATAHDIAGEDHIAFPLPVKNYNDLREKSLVPRILVVLCLPQNDALWLVQTEEQMISRSCAYWVSLLNQPPRTNSSTVTVHLPRTQQLTVNNLTTLMAKVSREEQL